MTRRRLLAPEVIQTSAMDCGPAALKCLLEGFGVPVSYGRLREACQTSVDGTSIDTLESLARTVGLDAEQVMMPVDHLLLPESEALPAIVVVRLPSGLIEFPPEFTRLFSQPARGTDVILKSGQPSRGHHHPCTFIPRRIGDRQRLL